MAFYSGDNCDIDGAVAEADNGCVAISGTSSGEYGSFNVIGGEGGGARLRRDTPAEEAIENPLKVEHGQVKHVFGGEYRWHQV